MEQEAWQILIVEDDQRLAELTQEYLQSNGLQVAIESDGARAAARILKEQPDLVVLDLMLPGEDGLSICRKVRGQYAGPILMLTARTDDMDQVLGLEMAQGLADGGAANTHALAQLALDQAVARLEMAGNDCVAESLQDLIAPQWR